MMYETQAIWGYILTMLDSTALYTELKQKVAPYTADAQQTMAALWPTIMQALIQAHSESLLEDPFAHLTDSELKLRVQEGWEAMNSEMREALERTRGSWAADEQLAVFDQDSSVR